MREEIRESVMCIGRETCVVDKYCFLISTESSDYFYNQTKFLLYSLRKYGGTLKDSFVYVSVNDAKLDEHRVKFLEENFGPIQIVNNILYKPKNRFPRGWFRKKMKFNRKYHVFSHFDKSEEFDKFVYIDTDMLVSDDFSDSLQKHKNASFVANAEFGLNAVIKNYDEFLPIFFENDINKINKLKSMWDSKTLSYKNQINSMSQRYTDVPSFQCGFFMVDEHTLPLLNFTFDYIIKLMNYIECGKLNLEAWSVEQQALSFLVMDKIDNYEILDSLDEGAKETLYHYYNTIYGKQHYETPLEINHEEYQKTNKLKFMSRIITEFHVDYGDVGN
jgi:hypothetical protein